MKAIVKRIDEEIGHFEDIENELKVLQDLVGGYIECITFEEIVVICDEEGLLKGKKRNCTVDTPLFKNSFVGDIVVVGHDEDDFTDVPIDLQKWAKMIGKERYI